MRVEITPTQYPIGIFYVPSSKTTNSFVLSFFFVLTTVERNSSEYPMVDLREKGMWPLSDILVLPFTDRPSLKRNGAFSLVL